MEWSKCEFKPSTAKKKKILRKYLNSTSQIFMHQKAHKVKNGRLKKVCVVSVIQRIRIYTARIPYELVGRRQPNRVLKDMDAQSLQRNAKKDLQTQVWENAN